MDVRQLTDRILEGSVPEHVIGIEEQNLSKFNQLGMKLDSILSTGGFMAGSAIVLSQAMDQLKAMDMEATRRAPRGTDYDEVMARREKYEKLNQQRRGWIKARGGAAVAAMVGILGRAGVFRALGQVVDKSRFKKALKKDIDALLIDLSPAHRDEIRPILSELLALGDPFTKKMKFMSLLLALVTKLRATGDPRYSKHIENTKKFADALGV